MQCAPVEHAEEMEYEVPWSLKAVESTAETVDPMDRVTRKGPTLFFQRAAPDFTASTVSVMSCCVAHTCVSHTNGYATRMGMPHECVWRV